MISFSFEGVCVLLSLEYSEDCKDDSQLVATGDLHYDNEGGNKNIKTVRTKRKKIKC